MRYVALVLAVTACLCACASGTGGSGARPQANLITAEEIAEANVNYAYEAVERLRPNWLVWRPGRSSTDPKPLVPVAFLDNTYLGDLDQLWTIVASEILEIRYLDDREAVYRYGTTYNSGIIQVIRR
jgi:hypothetical protein